MARSPATPESVVAIASGFPELGGGRLRAEPLGRGLINDTFAVISDGGSFVVQRVHPVFPPESHWNALAVTEHLRARGVLAPRLLAAADGRPWLEADGAIWRAMTRLPGQTHDAVQAPAQAYEAAAALGRFHRALVDLDHVFVGLRAGVHDTARHLANLRRALEDHPAHRLWPAAARLGDLVFDRVERLPALDDLPRRIVHGDPKFNNVLFDETGRAVALIDFDTAAPMALHLELGDAWRSWCNLRGEDDETANFRLEVYEASLRGWSSELPFTLSPAEIEAQVHGVEWITLELCARFLADALQESYFGWNRERFAGAGEHNLVRARGQWALHEQVLALRGERARVLREVLHGAVAGAAGTLGG